MAQRRTSGRQQEVDAAHPAPAWGRGKRNAGESGMPAGRGRRPSSASLGAVEAKCEQEAEAVKQEVQCEQRSGSGEAGSDLEAIPSSAVPSEHSSAVPSDDMYDIPSSAVPSDDSDDNDSDDNLCMLDFAVPPLDFAVKELGPLLQDGDLKSCGCLRGCWEAIAEDEEALSLWRSFSNDFGQLQQLQEKQEVDALVLDMLRHCGPNGGLPPTRCEAPCGPNMGAIFYVGKVAVCKKALKMFLGIGTHRMDRLLNHARQGGLTPPVDNRGGSHFSLTKSPEWFDADSWFCWAYHNIAEFVATSPMMETSFKAIEDLVPELSDFTVDGKQCRKAHAVRTDPSAPCLDVAKQLSDMEKLLSQRRTRPLRGPRCQ